MGKSGGNEEEDEEEEGMSGDGANGFGKEEGTLDRVCGQWGN
jgi:hypothetical protein